MYNLHKDPSHCILTQWSLAFFSLEVGLQSVQWGKVLHIPWQPNTHCYIANTILVLSVAKSGNFLFVIWTNTSKQRDLALIDVLFLIDFHPPTTRWGLSTGNESENSCTSGKNQHYRLEILETFSSGVCSTNQRISKGVFQCKLFCRAIRKIV